MLRSDTLTILSGMELNKTVYSFRWTFSIDKLMKKACMMGDHIRYLGILSNATIIIVW